MKSDVIILLLKNISKRNLTCLQSNHMRDMRNYYEKLVALIIREHFKPLLFFHFKITFISFQHKQR